jgi:ATP-dependent helicase Lhr and Lhr-like helicase
MTPPSKSAARKQSNLEERRTQAVQSRRSLNQRDLDTIGALDPDAVERVREEAWPQPESLEEVHDALLWMGYVTDEEAPTWRSFLINLQSQGRVIHENNIWRAVDGPTDPKKILLGRLEALGPVFEDAPEITNCKSQVPALLLELEHEGHILRTRLGGRNAWCERRLLSRIHRYTLERLRREIEPVSASEFLQFLTHWQHVGTTSMDARTVLPLPPGEGRGEGAPGVAGDTRSTPDDRKLEGPHGLAQVLNQLAGFEAPAWAWESQILPRRVRDYKREWLDDLTLSGEFVWGRFWGGAGSSIRVTPITFIPRDQLDDYLAMSEPPPTEGLTGPAKDLLKPLLAYGAMFPQALQKAAELVPTHMEMGLADLVARGFITCDSFAALRQMITPPSRRRHALRPVGRWTRLRTQPPQADAEHLAELVARQLLQRTGIVFRKTITREKFPVTWYALTRVFRRMELRGEIRGGRFVSTFAGEQYALPSAVESLRHLRRQGFPHPTTVTSADPLNFQGILTPNERVAPTTNQNVLVG